LPSNLAASSPGEQHEGDDQEEDNQHPVLRFEAEKTEFLHEKLHSAAPLLCKMRPLAEKIYYFDTTEESASIFGGETLRRKSRASLRTWRGNRLSGIAPALGIQIGRRSMGTVRSQVFGPSASSRVEFGWIMAGAIRRLMNTPIRRRPGIVRPRSRFFGDVSLARAAASRPRP
jgi:hypothetical protein